MRRFLLIDDYKTWEDREVLCIQSYNVPSTKEEMYPDVEFHEVRNFDAGITALKQGNWDTIYVDWDLESGGDQTGYQILGFLKENPEFKPKNILICSAHSFHSSELRKMAHEIMGTDEKDSE